MRPLLLPLFVLCAFFSFSSYSEESLNCSLQVRRNSNNSQIKINYDQLGINPGFQKLTVKNGSLEVKATKDIYKNQLQLDFTFVTKRNTTKESVILEKGQSVRREHKGGFASRDSFFSCQFTQDGKVSEEKLNRLLQSVNNGDLKPFKEFIYKGGDLLQSIESRFGSTFLMIGISSGLPTMVDFILGFLKNSPDRLKLLLDKQNESGETALMKALEIGSNDIAKKLIDAGADLNLVSAYSYNAFGFAVDTDNMDIVKYMIQKGLDIKRASRINHFRSYLLALQNESYQFLDFFHQNGIGPNLFISDSKETPLYYASARGTEKLLKYLLESGANDFLSGPETYTPATVAVANGKLNAFKILVEAGVDPNFQSLDKGSALYFAAINDRVDIIRYLIDLKVDLDNPFKDYTPLAGAVYQGHNDIVKLLINHGANVDFTHENGLPLVHQAVLRGHFEVLKTILEMGTKHLNKKTQGFTALFDAVRLKKTSFVELLAKNGAHVNLTAERGLTPLYLAAELKSPSIIRLLAKYGYHDFRAGMDGFSPLLVANYYGDFDSVKELIKRFDYNLDDIQDALKLLDEGDFEDENRKRKHLEYHRNVRRQERNIPDGLLNNAILKKNIWDFRKYLGNGVNPDKVYNGWSPVALVAKNNLPNFLEALLVYGPPLNLEAWTDGWSSLHHAAYEDSLDVLKILVENGVDINITVPGREETPLHIAARNNHVEIAKYLITKGANLYFDGNSPFCDAIERAKYWTIDLLMPHYPKNYRNKVGDTPMSCAVRSNATAVLDILTNEGFPYTTVVNGYNLLTYSIYFQAWRSAGYLLSRIDINEKDNLGNTPLSLAVKAGNIPFIKKLYDLGVRDFAKGILLAESEGLVKLAEYMKGLQLTPLFELIVQGDIERVNTEFNDANVNTAIDFGEYGNVTPLALAIKLGKLDVIEALVKKGADVNLQGPMRTPLGIAAKEKNLEAMKLLVSLGAVPSKGEYSPHNDMVSGGNTFSKEIYEYLDRTLNHTMDDASYNGNTLLENIILNEAKEAFRYFLRFGYYPESILVRLLTEDIVSLGQIAVLENPSWGKRYFDKCEFEECAENVSRYLLASMHYLYGDKNYTGEGRKYENFIMNRIKYGTSEQVLLISGENNDGFTQKDHAGNSPLHYAVKRGSVEIVRAINHASDLDFMADQNNAGRTPIHFAVMMNKLDILKYFLDFSSVDLNVSDNAGETALSLAKRLPGRGAMIDLLKSKGAQ